MVGRGEAEVVPDAGVDDGDNELRSSWEERLQENKISKEKMSMQAIVKYLDDNPNEVRRVLDFNPSFVTLFLQ